MSLVELRSEKAWENIFQEKCRYPDLYSHRSSPFARPHIQPKFKISKNEKIFTIGSCFARNVESILAEKGFELPSFNLVKRIQGKPNPNIHVHNKYNLFSILQELKWSFGVEDTPNPKERIVHTKNGKCVDFFLHMDPENIDICNWLAEQNTICFKESLSCSVWVITLGLSEVWIDKLTGRYVTEPQNFYKLWPDQKDLQQSWHDRFLFKLLSFNETLSCLQEVLDLIQRFVPQDTRVMITVSPVPMAGTFMNRDVMISNCYSKSLLRVAAEQVTQTNHNVDYFPSYESVMYSPRESAWQRDGIHVQQRMVEDVIQRMLHAYL
jgi:hypothetical protein